MRKAITLLVGLAAIGLVAFWALTLPDRVAPDEVADLVGDPEAGELVFWAAGCASCHAAPDAEGDARLVLSGGHSFVSDFGTFRAPNISSDPEHGIGDWSLSEFVTALQNGISPEGRNYYPAFPYTSYRHATREDLANLFAFMATLPASDVPSQPHDVRFPFSIRRLVGGWNLLYLRDDFAVTGDLGPEAERGRYLAEALSHCGECHTPRNALGAPDRSAWLGGAPNPSRDGDVPPLTPDHLNWSERDIANYLNDGFTPSFDSAGSNMVSVISSLARLPESDRFAIAAYLKALPELP